MAPAERYSGGSRGRGCHRVTVFRRFGKRLRKAIRWLDLVTKKKSPSPIPIAAARRATELLKVGAWRARSPHSYNEAFQGVAERIVSVEARLSSFTGKPVEVHVRELRIPDIGAGGRRVHEGPCIVAKTAAFPTKHLGGRSAGGRPTGRRDLGRGRKAPVQRMIHHLLQKEEPRPPPICLLPSQMQGTRT